MFTRRNFIQLGGAAVSSLALRPFGMLPALAQSGPDYRALVCVFLFGGNDSNNTVVPMDDANFKAYSSIRGSLALPSTSLTAPITSVSGEPYAFHSGLAELASLFGSKELAVVANVGSLVQPMTRALYQAQTTPVPLNLFSHSDQQLQWQTSIGQGNGNTGWGGRAADYINQQGLNSSKFPSFFSVAGNSLQGTGAQTTQVALAPGQSLELVGFNATAESQARLGAMKNLLTTNTGVSLVQTGQHGSVRQHVRRGSADGGTGQGRPAQDAVSGEEQHRGAVAAGGADYPGAGIARHAAADFLLLARRVRHPHQRTGTA